MQTTSEVEGGIADRDVLICDVGLGILDWRMSMLVGNVGQAISGRTLCAIAEDLARPPLSTLDAGYANGCLAGIPTGRGKVSAVRVFFCR